MCAYKKKAPVGFETCPFFPAEVFVEGVNRPDQACFIPSCISFSNDLCNHYRKKLGDFISMWQCAPLLVTITFCVRALLCIQSESKHVATSPAPVTSGCFPLTSAGFPVRSPLRGRGVFTQIDHF